MDMPRVKNTVIKIIYHDLPQNFPHLRCIT